ncbi:MAG: hypothetical protein IT340_07330 [Chloroflexi bacterium]|nr:hypothetical protein [Chloroflexota bacterium]
MLPPSAELTDASGNRMTLIIYGYQFEQADDVDDANWLVVGVEATDGQTQWAATDAALLTWEVAQLSRWLREVATGNAYTASLAFIEPMLVFAAHGDGASLRVTVTLAYSFRPPWLPAFETWQVRLCPSVADVQACAAALEAALARFPIRDPAGG